MGPGSQLTNNYAKSSGGAIYLARGTINLNSDASGDILFEGNYDALSSWTGSNASWTPNLDSGKRNAVHLGGGIFNVNTGANSAVHFKDPITSSGTPTFNKGGAGDMIFYDYSSTPQMTMNVNLGRLVLRNDKMFTPMIEYGAVNGGKLTVGKKTLVLQRLLGRRGRDFVQRSLY